jgi:FkbM family methyltransferase
MAQFGADFEVGERLIARYNNIRVNIDNTEDVQIFKEVFFGNEYRFVSPSDCVVIDIGMNVGMASLAFAANTRVQKVYAFEPFRGPYLRARRNFELNVELSKKIEVRNCGLSNRAEQLSVKSDELSSIGTSVKGTNSGRIETIDLRDASEELKDCFREAKERNLKIVCKVDCEGSEFPIFESLDKSGMFREIDAVVMEWHKTWSEDKNQGDLIGPLMKAEFLTFDRSNPANDQTGFLISVRLSDNASPVAIKKSYPSVRNALARITGLAASASRGAVQARPRR